MTTNYADPFGVQEATPLSRALRRIDLQQSAALNWPAGYLGPDYIASINVIIPAADGLFMNLPDALGANEGTGFLMVNEGLYTVIINDYDGTQITVIDAGQAKYMFAEQVTDSAGVWHTQTFGEGVSQADAVELAGSGLVPIGGKLSLGMTITTTASDFQVNASHRGKIIVNTGGSINVNLPQYTDVGNNFFVGVHNGGSGTVTVQPNNGNVIDDYPSLALSPNESLFVYCSGTTKWYTVGYGRSTQFQFTKLVKDVSAGGNIVLTSAEASNKLLQFIGTPASNVNVIVPSVVGIYYVQNAYTGPYSLTLKTQNGNGLALNSGDRAIVYCDGVNIVSAQSVAVGVNISVIDGSLGTPSINFSSDTGTGLYKADLHTVGISSNGGPSAQFASDKSSVTGKFGIGTNNPAAELHIVSGAGEGIRIQGTTGYVSFFSTDGATRNGIVQGNTSEMHYGVDDTANGAHRFFVGTNKVLEVTSTGIHVYGNIVDGSGNAYATLGNNVYTGIQITPVVRGKIRALGNVSGTVSIDVSTANTFTMTCVGPTTVNFTGSPASGQDQAIYLKTTNGNITWGNMCQFNNSGLRPVPTSNGKDVFAVWYYPEVPAYVVGRAYQDYK